MILLSKCKWLEAILGAKKADGLQPKQPLSLSAAALLREALGAPGAGSWMGAMLRLPCVVAVSCV